MNTNFNNVTIYLDESGDLGFDWQKSGTSSVFTIALLVCGNKPISEKIGSVVKKVLRKKINHKKTNKRIINELKGSSTTYEIKKYFYENLPESDWDIYSVTLNKKRVYPELQTSQGKKKLYNYLARILIEQIPFKDYDELISVNLVMDKCKNNAETKDFNQYLKNNIEAFLPDPKIPFYINHEDSCKNKGLQAIDLFCWGISRKNRESKWYDIFKSKIKFETTYLP